MVGLLIGMMCWVDRVVERWGQKGRRNLPRKVTCLWVSKLEN